MFAPTFHVQSLRSTASLPVTVFNLRVLSPRSQAPPIMKVGPVILGVNAHRRKPMMLFGIHCACASATRGVSYNIDALCRGH